MRMGRLNVALTILSSLCTLGVLSKEAAGQERIYAIKGGDTIELQTVWHVKNCKSDLTAAPTVEVLDGPPQVKLWVEPAMVVASRLNCVEPTTGGKLMATADTIKQKTDVKITFRTTYQTSDGERQVARTYQVSLFPGEGRDRKAEPSRSWNSFLASIGTTGDNKAASRLAEPSSVGKSRSARKIIKRHKLTRVASADQVPPSGSSREALYASCRHRTFAKYGWNQDGKKWMWREQSLAMIDNCVTHGGKVP